MAIVFFHIQQITRALATFFTGVIRITWEKELQSEGHQPLFRDDHLRYRNPETTHNHGSVENGYT